MFNTLKRLFSLGKIDTAGIDSAVSKGWITKKQAKEIITSKKEE
jgi:hypothetical protein